MRGMFRRNASHRESYCEAPWLLRTLSTPLRSHLACGVCAIGLIGLASWIWLHPDSLATDRAHTQTQIEDAIALVSSRDRLQNRYEKASDQRQRFQNRIDQIADWLPPDRSWESIRLDLQTAAATCDVQLIALERDAAHYGSRVAVIEVRCEAQGAYANICRFLQYVAEQKHPIWCDEVRLVRNGPKNRLSRPIVSDHQSVECLATLSLRAPLAGKETTAAKLLQRRRHDET